jgi:hypothetical protein
MGKAKKRSNQISLEYHKALVRADARWEKMTTNKRGQFENKYAYLKNECGHLFPKTIDTFDAWHSLLKRAHAHIKQSRKDADDKKKTKQSAKSGLLLSLQLDEEEFVEDHGWILKAMLWIPLLCQCISRLTNPHEGFRTTAGSAHILCALGFGSAFVNQLACRALSQFNCCAGDIQSLGTGTYRVANVLCRIKPSVKAPNLANVVLLYAAVKPLLEYMVLATLGASWVQLVTFQLFQSLLCEKRKWEDKTRMRRPGSEDRSDHYMSQLETYAHAVGILLDEEPHRTRPPLFYSASA